MITFDVSVVSCIMLVRIKSVLGTRETRHRRRDATAGPDSFNRDRSRGIRARRRKVTVRDDERASQSHSGQAWLLWVVGGGLFVETASCRVGAASTGNGASSGIDWLAYEMTSAAYHRVYIASQPRSSTHSTAQQH